MSRFTFAVSATALVVLGLSACSETVTLGCEPPVGHIVFGKGSGLFPSDAKIEAEKAARRACGQHMQSYETSDAYRQAADKSVTPDEPVPTTEAAGGVNTKIATSAAVGALLLFDGKNSSSSSSGTN